jgi:hypothetical protein
MQIHSVIIELSCACALHNFYDGKKNFSKLSWKSTESRNLVNLIIIDPQSGNKKRISLKKNYTHQNV